MIPQMQYLALAHEFRAHFTQVLNDFLKRHGSSDGGSYFLSGTCATLFAD